MKLNLIFPLILSLSLLTNACGDSSESPQNTSPTCANNGTAVESGGETYCVYQSAITEEGFDCPPDFSSQFRLGTTTVVCTSKTQKNQIPEGVIKDVVNVIPQEVKPTGGCATTLCDANQVCEDGGMCKVPVSDTVKMCVDGCGLSGLPPGEQLCGSDGNLYLGKCELECNGATVEEDKTKCNTSNDDAVKKCVEGCGLSGLPPWAQLCGSDGQFYLGQCELECNGATVVQDRTQCRKSDDKTVMCRAACDQTCDADGSQICGQDGLFYCNQCIFDCEGIPKQSTSDNCMN